MTDEAEARIDPAGPADGVDAVAGVPAAAGIPEPESIEHAPVEVGLQRSVRFGRIIVVAAAVGAVVGAIACLFFPVVEEAEYTLGQIAGFMAVVGGAIGLCLGALLSLILALAVRNDRGAAMAKQTDVS